MLPMFLEEVTMTAEDLPVWAKILLENPSIEDNHCKSDGVPEVSPAPALRGSLRQVVNPQRDIERLDLSIPTQRRRCHAIPCEAVL
jgi:hypothetical protein